MPKIKGKKGNTPEHFDEFINMREVLDPDEYTDYWRGVNKLKKQHGGENTPEFAEAWNAYNDAWLARRHEGVVIPPPPEEVAPIRRSKGWGTRDMKRLGGTVVRVDRFGVPNKRGRHWRAI